MANVMFRMMKRDKMTLVVIIWIFLIRMEWNGKEMDAVTEFKQKIWRSQINV